MITQVLREKTILIEVIGNLLKHRNKIDLDGGFFNEAMNPDGSPTYQGKFGVFEFTAADNTNKKADL